MMTVAVLSIIPYLLTRPHTVALQQDGPPQVGSSQVMVEVSSTAAVTRAWSRTFVMQAPDGSLLNDGGKVPLAADVAAIDEVAGEAGQVSDAAYVATTNALKRLFDATNGMATASQAYALVMPPLAPRDTLTRYVVDESTDGTNDVQWVWFSCDVALRPNRYVTYRYMDYSTDVKCTWDEWVSTGAVHTVDGVAWSGCHRCTVRRPDWAVGVACLTRPYDSLGGPNGFTTGDLVLKVGDGYGWTGYVTNDLVNPKVEHYYDSGVLKSVQEVVE